MDAFVATAFSVVADQGDAGLVGTLSVEVYAPASGEPIVGPTTDGIFEIQPGVYQAQLVVPIAGRFRIRWSYPAPGGPVTAEEDLWVWPNAVGGVSGGAFGHILKHVAIPVRYEEGTAADAWIEGEPGATGPEPVRGVAFPVVLFLPLGTEETAGSDAPRPRKFSRPTLLFEPLRPADWPVQPGTPIVLGADDELLILAPELGGYFRQADGEAEGTGRWQVDGRPQPFGPPGEVIGAQANVKQVTD